jgi:hypothetical protein
MLRNLNLRLSSPKANVAKSLKVNANARLATALLNVPILVPLNANISARLRKF